MRVSLSVFVAVLFNASLACAGEPPILTVYTYDSFVSEWGPGPAIQAGFEKICACRIEWVGLEDGAALLSRLKLEGAESKADVILGLDNNLTAEAAQTGLFADHDVATPDLKLPVPWRDKFFVPYDYGYFAMIYDAQSLKVPPASLADLVGEGNQPKVILMDPRASTPGLGFLLWVKAVYADKAGAAWQSIARRTLTVAKGWSEGYGLFLKGEAPVVLSYTTSPAYHQMMEKTDRYRAAMFPEGHYLEIEVAGRLAASDQPELARAFLAFLVSRQVQEVIPTTNWMYPVIDIGDALPEVFRKLPMPAKSLMLPSEDVALHRAKWIEEWLESTAR